MKQPVKTFLSTAISMALASHNLHAGSFSLYTEGSAAAIGNYAAGIAAQAGDAATGWYNPAGLVFLAKQQAILSGVGVLPSSPLTGTSLFDTELELPPYRQSFTDLDGAKNALVPAFHYALPLTPLTAFGLSVVSPFGLSTEYENNSPVRYAGTLSKLLTVNVSPELAHQFSEHVSLGAGLDLQWAQVTFNAIQGAPNLGITPQALDANSDNKGDSFAVGFHVGALAWFNDKKTRLGLNYQSRMRHKFTGSSTLTALGEQADLFFDTADNTFRINNLYSNPIYFPEVVTLSGYQAVNEKLVLLGSVVYTGWGVFKTIQLNNIAALDPQTGLTTLDEVAVQNYRNAWRFALGADYQINDRFMMRVGAGYDQTPTINAERDIRLPDANRWALSIGAHYQPYPAFGLDVGYSYLFANGSTSINKTIPIGDDATYNVTAQSKPHANLVGVQAVWTIDANQKSTK